MTNDISISVPISEVRTYFSDVLVPTKCFLYAKDTPDFIQSKFSGKVFTRCPILCTYKKRTQTLVDKVLKRQRYTLAHIEVPGWGKNAESKEIYELIGTTVFSLKLDNVPHKYADRVAVSKFYIRINHEHTLTA